MEQLRQDETLLQKFEVEIKKAGECTVIDFLREVSPNEFELEQIRHHHEWENLLQKLKYRSSVERKIELLNTELESTIDYLDSDEEGEVRHIFGDFSQTKLDKVIDKVKYIAQTFMKSNEWKTLDYKQKQQFLNIKNLRSDLINENMPFHEVHRILLRKVGLRILTDKDKKRERATTLNRQFAQLVNGLFYDHFQVELNRKIQGELKKIALKDELSELNEVEDIDDSDKIVINKPKIKQRIAGDSITSLSLTQTALLFNLLRKEKVIFKDESYQSKENIYKAIQVLTGYSKQNLKVKMNLKEYEDSDKVVTQKILKRLMY